MKTDAYIWTRSDIMSWFCTTSTSFPFFLGNFQTTDFKDINFVSYCVQFFSLQIIDQFIRERKSFHFMYDFENKWIDHGGDEFSSGRRH